MEYSLNTFEKLIEACKNNSKEIYEIMQEKESYDFEISIDDVRYKVKKTLNAMKSAIKNGINSSQKSMSGLCGDDCVKFNYKYKKQKSLFGEVFEKITCYALSTVEENLRMNIIAACPTAGSCGIVPSVLIALSEKYNLSTEEEINALITAGAIGYVISAKMPMAGAVGGCQAECGVASAMAAGCAVYIMKGNTKQIVNAAALALKNVLGLTCDPVSGLVEIPCVKRNVFLAVHAITAAELSIADIETKIPADEVVDAMVQTGQLMSPLLKETSQGGLATVKTSIALAKR